MMKKLLIICLVFISLTVNAALTLQLDKSKVLLGQTFRLSVMLADAKNKKIPDLTALRKDFTIVGTERTISYSIINGQAHSLNQWVMVLMPNRAGVLTIPSIHIGQEQTIPAQIEVMEKTSTPAEEVGSPVDAVKDAVKLVAMVSENNPYVNQQVIYTVKLYNSRRLLDADYEPPKVKNALMLTLGDAKRYQVTKQGTPYVVDEIQYAFFPQKSGELTIKPPKFSALVFDSVPGKVQVRAKEIHLHVEPAPTTDIKTIWLPAKQVTLSEHYDKTDAHARQGDLLVRTVMLKAVGAAAQLLPPLRFVTGHQYRVYPEKPVEKTRYLSHDLVGTTTLNVTYLLNKSGTITIPKLTLPWFNTVTGKREVASLPAKTITVAEDVNAAIAKEGVASSSNQTALLPTVTVTASTFKTKSNWMVWWAVGFAVAWLVTLLLWWWTRCPRTGNPVKQSRKRLRLACLGDDPLAAKEAIMDWALATWPGQNITNLQGIAELITDPMLKKDINQLSETLYRAQTMQRDRVSWQGTQFWQYFIAYQVKKRTTLKVEKNSLPPVNP